MHLMDRLPGHIVGGERSSFRAISTVGYYLYHRHTHTQNNNIPALLCMCMYMNAHRKRSQGGPGAKNGGGLWEGLGVARGAG